MLQGDNRQYIRFLFVFWGPFRRRVALSPIRLFRTEVIATVRTFHRHLAGEEFDVAAEDANTICKGFARAMADLLHVDESAVNCLIKVSPPDAINASKLADTPVQTLAAAQDFQDRKLANPSKQPRVRDNSAWAALFGVHDGVITWPKLECFASKNLTKNSAKYRSHLDDWPSYYKSVLAFPIRFQGRNAKYYQIGMLIFESQRTDIFGDLPDVYKYDVISDLTKYRSSLNNRAEFHYGMAMAELLTSAMRRYWYIPPAESASFASTETETLSNGARQENSEGES